MANFQKLQLSLILRVAGQIWQILQISAAICRILQIHQVPQILSQNSSLKNLQKSVPKKSYNLTPNENFFREDLDEKSILEATCES
jgi:hypothetical protein